MIVAVGLGSVASIGFSVISDFISPRRRGLAMSLWGLSQGAGGADRGAAGEPAGRRRLPGADARHRRPRVRLRPPLPGHVRGPAGMERARAAPPPRRSDVRLRLHHRTRAGSGVDPAAHQRVAHRPGADGATGLWVAHLGAVAVPGEGDRRGLLHRHRHQGRRAARRHLPGRGAVLGAHRLPRRPGPGAPAGREGADQRHRGGRRHTLLPRLPVHPAARPGGHRRGGDVHAHPRGARPGAHQPVGGRRLPARHGRPGPDVGELPQLVRPHRRRQPARASGHRLRFGQPGERGGAVGGQRPHRRGGRHRGTGHSHRRSTGRWASLSSRSSSSPPATATGGRPRHRRPTSPRRAPCSRRGATGGSRRGHRRHSKLPRMAVDLPRPRVPLHPESRALRRRRWARAC